jgi:hypothetical protein
LVSFGFIFILGKQVIKALLTKQVTQAFSAGGELAGLGILYLLQTSSFGYVLLSD